MIERTLWIRDGDILLHFTFGSKSLCVGFFSSLVV